jgi:hypothetical protein
MSRINGREETIMNLQKDKLLFYIVRILIIGLAAFFLLKKYDYEVLCESEFDSTCTKLAGDLNGVGTRMDHSYSDARWKLKGEITSGALLCTTSIGNGKSIESDKIIEQLEYTDGMIDEIMEIGDMDLQTYSIWAQLEEDSTYHITVQLEAKSRGYQIILDKLGLYPTQRI